MPISSESFEQGKILPYAEVLSYLQSDPDKGHTIEEIYQGTVTSLEYSIDQLLSILKDLSVEGSVEAKVDAREIEGRTYYRIRRRRLGFPLPER